MTSRKNKDVIVRALKILKLFSERNLTTNQVAQELGIKRQSAGRWIAAASIVLPITEVGTVREGSPGPESINYGLMKG